MRLNGNDLTKFREMFNEKSLYSGYNCDYIFEYSIRSRTGYASRDYLIENDKFTGDVSWHDGVSDEEAYSVGNLYMGELNFSLKYGDYDRPEKGDQISFRAELAGPTYKETEPRYADGPSAGSQVGSYCEAVLIPDGRIIFVPMYHSRIGIYDPVTNIFTNGPFAGDSSGSFNGAALLSDGRIIFAPYNYDRIGIYDPISNIYTDGPAAGNVFSRFNGCVALDDGRVIMAPYGYPNIGIYDSITNIYIDGPAAGTGQNTFEGCCIARNGDIIFSPSNYTKIGIYKPSTNTYRESSADITGQSKFSGCVQDDNGNIIFSPFSSAYIGIYNNITDTFTDGPIISGTWSGGKSSGCVKLSDGRIVFVPFSKPDIIIYNPDYNSYETISGAATSQQNFSSGAVIPGDIIIFSPYNNANIGIFNPYFELPKRSSAAAVINRYVVTEATHNHTSKRWDYKCNDMAWYYDSVNFDVDESLFPMTYASAVNLINGAAAHEYGAVFRLPDGAKNLMINTVIESRTTCREVIEYILATIAANARSVPNNDGAIEVYYPNTRLRPQDFNGIYFTSDANLFRHYQNSVEIELSGTFASIRRNAIVVASDGRIICIENKKLEVFAPWNFDDSGTVVTPTIDASIDLPYSYLSGCAAKDNKIILTGTNTVPISIYDVSENTILVTDNYFPYFNYIDEIVIDESICLFLPNAANNNIIIYDYKSNSIELGPFLNNKFLFWIKVENKLIMFPDTSVSGNTKIGIYDITLNSFSYGSDIPYASTYYLGQSVCGALLPDGRILYPPMNINQQSQYVLLFYNTKTDTFTSQTISDGYFSSVSGAALIDVNRIARVVMIPQQSGAYIYTYDISSSSITRGPVTSGYKGNGGNIVTANEFKYIATTSEKEYISYQNNPVNVSSMTMYGDDGYTTFREPGDDSGIHIDLYAPWAAVPHGAFAWNVLANSNQYDQINIRDSIVNPFIEPYDVVKCISDGNVYRILNISPRGGAMLRTGLNSGEWRQDNSRRSY